MELPSWTRFESFYHMHMYRKCCHMNLLVLKWEIYLLLFYSVLGVLVLLTGLFEEIMTRHSSVKRNYHSLWSKIYQAHFVKGTEQFIKVVSYKLSLKKINLRIENISYVLFVQLVIQNATCIVDILVHLFFSAEYKFI